MRMNPLVKCHEVQKDYAGQCIQGTFYRTYVSSYVDYTDSELMSNNATVNDTHYQDVSTQRSVSTAHKMLLDDVLMQIIHELHIMTHWVSFELIFSSLLIKVQCSRVSMLVVSNTTYVAI